MLKLLKFNKFCLARLIFGYSKPKIWSGLNRATISAIILILAFNMPIGRASAAWSYSDAIALLNNRAKIRQNLFLVTGGDSLMGINAPPRQKTIRTILTAYSSTPDQTDDTPFITASGTRTRDGIIAANFLAFGTRVQIPEIFGDKVFVVEDRMAKKHSDKIDIWFPERHLAKKFGVQQAEVIILQ